MPLPPGIVQPDTFVFTDQEAAAVQSVQLARQASIIGSSPLLRFFAIGVTVVLLGGLIGLNILWYEDEMPVSLFITLPAAFIAGVYTQTLAYWVTREVGNRRLRETTRQVSAPRTVRLTEESIEQALPDMRAFYARSGIDKVEPAHGLILVWSGNLLASAVPMRAFPAPADADAFLQACNERACPPDKTN